MNRHTLGHEEVLEHHLPLINQAREATTSDARREVLIEGIILFGHRFLRTLSMLVEAEIDSILYQEAAELFGVWLQGISLTDRTDEAHRRAEICWEALEFEGLEWLAAKGLLGLPEEHPRRGHST